MKKCVLFLYSDFIIDKMIDGVRTQTYNLRQLIIFSVLLLNKYGIKYVSKSFLILIPKIYLVFYISVTAN